MSSHLCYQHNIRNSLLFNRLACIWILFFVFATTSSAITTDWLSDVLSSVGISAPSQLVEQAVVPLQPTETETDVSDDLLLLLPASVGGVPSAVSACFALLFLFFSVSWQDRWRAPACPRPPPSLLTFFS